MSKKRNPNDTTFRNINALKDKFDIMARHIHLVDKTLDALVDMTSGLMKRVEKLERKLHNAHIR